MKIVFMGTPTFGREILKCLHQNGYDVVLAVCQPDKYVGRKHVLTSCEVKQYCIENNIEVFQPVKIREDYSRVLQVNPDLIVTCAYGQIIPKIILDKCKCINVHASLLPKLRGGAPIQHAIIDGYSTTGITIMEMSNKMDAGDIISQAAIDIDINDTYSSLHDKLIEVATSLLIETLPSIINNSYIPKKQDVQEVTFGYNILPQQEHIDFNKSYMQVYNQIRGLADVPYAYGLVDGKKVKLCHVSTSDIVSENKNGTIVFVGKGLGVVVDNRVIVIDKIQLEGKNITSSKDFRNGVARNWQGVVMC
ncbi:MAG: methionyl-tRNA formyltransferase [Erysipelotrichaceae bacterium]|nr:methionyl-tRNA formyltransferase [Erysipelotrichaceae bacterium]